MKTKLIFAIALALLAFTMVMFAMSVPSSDSKNQAVSPINQLYVFGDSLSDTGTIYNATGGAYPPSPPYFQGRYSNGPVWVEHLASKLAVTLDRTHNFAAGGATSGANGSYGVPGLLSQVKSFTTAHSQADPQALYVIWAGANDYLQGATSPTIVVKNLMQAIESLSKVGAQNILVGNLPDLGQLPSTRNTSNSSPLSAVTQAHNLSLAQSLKGVGAKVKIISLDANTLYQEAETNPDKFGFTNVTTGCLSAPDRCRQPDTFLFWDGIHPTTAAHRALGEIAFSALQVGQRSS